MIAEIVDKPPLLAALHEAMDLLDGIIAESGNPRVVERCRWAKNETVKAAAYHGYGAFSGRIAVMCVVRYGESVGGNL